MRINIVTIFPSFFEGPLALSIPKRARDTGLVDYKVVDLRDYAHDRHRSVDDVPYGGGAGMVLKPEPFFEAVDALDPMGPVVLLTPRGRVFKHQDVDQRVAEHLATEEISLGDFVLSGGEIAALSVLDSVVRLLPGALGDHDSAASDSFYEEELLSAPSYTRPPEYRGHGVPDVLLTGDHAKIAAWRRGEAERITRERRPELWSDRG